MGYEAIVLVNDDSTFESVMRQVREKCKFNGEWTVDMDCPAIRVTRDQESWVLRFNSIDGNEDPHFFLKILLEEPPLNDELPLKIKNFRPLILVRTDNDPSMDFFNDYLHMMHEVHKKTGLLAIDLASKDIF